jgi:plasmid stabilization system protein ParE
MAYHVVITEAAWSDMFEMGRQIKLQNAVRAETFVQELYQRCNALVDFPKSHVLIADPKSRGVRRVVTGII